MELKNFGAKARNLIAAAVGMGLTGLAMAQETDPFTTTMASMTTKVSTYAGALVGLAAVGVGFAIAIKYVKKIPRAA